MHQNTVYRRYMYLEKFVCLKSLLLPLIKKQPLVLIYQLTVGCPVIVITTPSVLENVVRDLLITVLIIIGYLAGNTFEY